MMSFCGFIFLMFAENRKIKLDEFLFVVLFLNIGKVNHEKSSFVFIVRGAFACCMFR